MDGQLDPNAFATLQRQLVELQKRWDQREEAESALGKTIPVMNMFSHGNVVIEPAGPKIDAKSFELKISLINKVEQNAFAGRATEDAHRHLTRFLEIASTIKQNGVDDDAIRVRLFPFSLIDSAKDWYECLPADKVSKWEDIVVLFLDNYYPLSTILKLKGEIYQFVQGHDEPLYEALARFKALLRKCYNHGFKLDEQVAILYNGFNEKISSLLDSGANGSFMKRGGKDAMEVIEELAASSRSWSRERNNSRRIAAVDNTAKAQRIDMLETEVATLSSTVTYMATQIEKLTSQLQQKEERSQNQKKGKRCYTVQIVETTKEECLKTEPTLTLLQPQVPVSSQKKPDLGKSICRNQEAMMEYARRQEEEQRMSYREEERKIWNEEQRFQQSGITNPTNFDPPLIDSDVKHDVPDLNVSCNCVLIQDPPRKKKKKRRAKKKSKEKVQPTLVGQQLDMAEWWMKKAEEIIGVVISLIQENTCTSTRPP